MRHLAVVAFLALLAACATSPPPMLAPLPGPDDSTAPTSDHLIQAAAHLPGIMIVNGLPSPVRG